MSDDEQKKPAGKRPFRAAGGRDAAPGAKRGPRPADKRAPRKSPEPEADGERIAKRLARAGIASRRDAEELIAAGRVKVNGKVLASPAVNVGPDDRIEVDSTEIPPVERTRLFLFHKPAGVVTTNRDPEGRTTVFDVLPADLPRLITIGRLDINTEGLLLLTNDGGLARLLELPSTGWLRRYRARVHGKVDEKALPGLKDGMAVDGVFYGSIEASLDREQGANAWMTIGLREGKNREVKNILGALGLDVTRLIRISYGPFQLGELKEGEVHEVRGRLLRDQLGERLIEEAGANFDAPIIHHREGPRRDEPEARPARAAPPAVKRDGERGPIGEGGLIKRRKRREDARGDALARLDTKPGFQKRPPRGEGRDRDAPAAQTHMARKANVWMAPGARPLGKENAAEADTKPRPARQDRPDRAPRAARPDDGKKPFRPRPRPEGGSAERPERATAPRRYDRPDGDKKPFRPRPRPNGEQGEAPTRAAKAQRFGKPEGTARPAGDKKPFRDRNAAPAVDKPRSRPRPEGAERFATGGAERPKRFDKRPMADKSFRDRNAAPASDKPRSRPRPEGAERPATGGAQRPKRFDKRPMGDKSFRDRNAAPAADRPRSRPRPEGAERPATGGAERPKRFEKRPAGDKPFKPRGPRPEGGRGPKPEGRRGPAGQGRPAGGKPRPSGPGKPRSGR